VNLRLPDHPIPDRLSLVQSLDSFSRRTFAELEGPGCIQHLWVTVTRKELGNRNAVIRIYFDGEPVPHVEAPVGDFFGVMHGKKWYPVNTRYLSVKAESGYNCYFPMPFASSARIEFETGGEAYPIYLMADWHRYPGQQMTEPRRFCARWRREWPTQRYGEEFLMLDADGSGQLLGFVYGVRLLDDTDRWSHGGSDNLYLDGEGEHPVFIRGIGGEDTFGTSYGGALHPPETHLYAGLPHYVHEDTGEARPAHRLVGYRFFEHDTVPFQESIQLRFGCMRNDICATTYWYSEKPVRPFAKLPEWERLTCLQEHFLKGDPSKEMPRGAYDLPVPTSGEWWLCGPFGNKGDRAMNDVLAAETSFEPEAVLDGLHEDGSPWLSEGSRSLGRNVACWVKRSANHGFIDFNHVFRPVARGVSRTHPGVAVARCVLRPPRPTTARVQLAWDDRLLLRVNDQRWDLGDHPAFRKEVVEVPLKAGDNTVLLKLSNTIGSNHGGWAFAFSAVTAEGHRLLPQAE
jgi:hypothetical protein